MPLGRLLEKLINPCWNVVVTASIALAMPRAEFARDKRSVHDDGNLEKHIRVREGQLFLDMFMYIVIYCNYTYCFFSSVHFVILSCFDLELRFGDKQRPWCMFSCLLKGSASVSVNWNYSGVSGKKWIEKQLTLKMTSLHNLPMLLEECQTLQRSNARWAGPKVILLQSRMRLRSSWFALTV